MNIYNYHLDIKKPFSIVKTIHEVLGKRFCDNLCYFTCGDGFDICELSLDKWVANAKGEHLGGDYTSLKEVKLEVLKKEFSKLVTELAKRYDLPYKKSEILEIINEIEVFDERN